VQRRTVEIGLRVALGAERGAVIGLVMRETLAQAAAGVVLGLPMAIAGTRLIGLAGVAPADVEAVAAATVMLVGCLAVAGYVPARRAARFDPAAVLRTE
jgi:macrolide transport system ATP-binding/permease protein